MKLKISASILKYPLSVFLLCCLCGCTFNYLDYYQHIEVPDGEYNFGLYGEPSFGDPGFMVLKLEKEIDPEKLAFNYKLFSGGPMLSEEEQKWIDSRTVLYNYEESSYFSSNAKIELLHNRFLVFSRGGYHFSLYDLKTESAPFNDANPWYYGGGGSNEKSSYGTWIKTNLHDKINDYIEANR